jgi:hypothetical protein
MKLGRYDSAPVWVEQTAPQGRIKREQPSLLLIDLGQQEHYVVATLEETNAIADPNSFIGRLLRSHCALMALSYVSNN